MSRKDENKEKEAWNDPLNFVSKVSEL